jgi:hypothetical protein
MVLYRIEPPPEGHVTLCEAVGLVDRQLHPKAYEPNRPPEPDKDENVQAWQEWMYIYELCDHAIDFIHDGLKDGELQALVRDSRTGERLRILSEFWRDPNCDTPFHSDFIDESVDSKWHLFAGRTPFIERKTLEGWLEKKGYGTPKKLTDIPVSKRKRGRPPNQRENVIQALRKRYPEGVPDNHKGVALAQEINDCLKDEGHPKVSETTVDRARSDHQALLHKPPK